MIIITKGKAINEVTNIERKYASLAEFNHAEGKNINNAIKNNIIVEYFSLNNFFVGIHIPYMYI
jgi:hypothetical protein